MLKNITSRLNETQSSLMGVLVLLSCYALAPQECIAWDQLDISVTVYYTKDFYYRGEDLWYFWNVSIELPSKPIIIDNVENLKRWIDKLPTPDNGFVLVVIKDPSGDIRAQYWHSYGQGYELALESADEEGEWTIEAYYNSVSNDYDITQVGQPPQTQVIYNYLNSDQPGYIYKFSIVHLSDLHIGEGYGDYATPGYDDADYSDGDGGESAQELARAMYWINANLINEDIRFVIATGDITDSGERSEFERAKKILDLLDIPYVPLIGNHDIWPYTSTQEAGNPNGDAFFREAFAAQFDRLRTTFSNWDDGTRLTYTWNTEANCPSYFQNFAFDYEGYHFICTDFNTRIAAFGPLKGTEPQADLMNFGGGTWPWVMTHYESHRPTTPSENMLIFDHHPLTTGWLGAESFTTDEKNTITNFLGYSNADHTGWWSAGHTHDDMSPIYYIQTVSNTEVCPGEEVDANKDYANGCLRVLKIYGRQ